MSSLLEDLSINRTLDSRSISSEDWDKLYTNLVEEPIAKQTEKYDEGWRKILHIPFDPVWRVLLMVLVSARILILIASISIYNINLTQTSYEGNLLSYGYLCLMYFLDTLLHTMAKQYRTQRSTSLNIFLPTSVLVCDFLSCLPLGVFLPSSIAMENKYLASLLQMNEILRIIRLLYMFADYRETVGVSHMAALYLNAFFFITLGMFISISTAYLILRPRWSGRENNLILSSTKLGSNCVVLVFLHNVVEQDDIATYLYITSAMFIGFSYFTVYSLALVLTKLKAVLKQRFVFLTIKKFFDYRWKYLSSTQDLYDTFKDVYQTMWINRQGYLDVDMNFSDVITNSMQKDLFLDINCPLFKHSKVFRKMDLAFLRILASMVKHEHLFAGQVIYRRNAIKNRMIYLANGRMSVMSQWDEDTAILTFSKGTVLGESSLVISSKSITTVRCETYCVIYFIERKEFERCCVKFPEQHRKINAAINKRVERTKKLKQLVILANQKLKTSTSLNQNCIMWLKLTLHSLMMKDEITSSKHKIQNLFLAVDFSMEKFKGMQFTAENLDMLVIAERKAMSSDSVFKSTTFPWIITSENVIKSVWDFVIIVLAIAFTAFFLFYGFGLAEVPLWMKRFSEFITIVYFFDTYILLSTVVRHNNGKLTKMKDIISYHVRHLRFYLDLFAAFPTEIFLCIFDHQMSARNFTLIRGNRCLKLWRIYLLFKERQKRSSTETLLWAYFTHVIIFTAIYFSCACVVFLVRNNLQSKDEGTTMFWYFFATETIVSSSGLLGKIHVLEDSGILSAIIRLISMFLFIIAFSHLCAIHILQEFPKTNYKIFINEIQYFSKLCNFSDRLRRRIHHLLVANWQLSCGNDLLHNLPLYPNNVRTLYKTHMFYQKLLQNPLFKNISGEALREVCANVTMKSLPVREILAYADKLCNASVFILRGYIKKISEHDILSDSIYGPGDHLMFLEAWTNVKTVNNYISASTVIFLEITTKTWKILNTKYPNDFARITKIMNELSVRTKLENMRSRHTLKDVRQLVETPPPVTPSVYSFGYNLALDSQEEYEYFVPFDRSSTWGWTQYILLRYTFLPDGKFLIVWEIIRCFLFLVNLFWRCFYFPSTDPLSKWYWSLWLDLFFYVDIYIRLHVCYYNDNGILVCHPLKTAYHYLTHSFVTDFVAARPLYWLFSNENYYFYNYVMLLQLYRYAGIVSYVENYGLANNLFLANLKFGPPFFCICIVLGNLLIRQACRFDKGIKGSAEYAPEVLCHSGTWITNVTSARPMSSEHVQFYAIYLAAVALTSCGAIHIRLTDFTSAVIVSFMMVASFFSLAFMFSTVVNEHLAKGNRYLRHNLILNLIKKLMRKERIKPFLQDQVVKHFDLKWLKTKGLQKKSAFDKFPICLKKDIIYDMYGKILHETSIFPSEGSLRFLRNLGIHLTHDVAIKDCFIAAINDIVSNVYILLSGSVEVVGPDGSVLTKLYTGSMFGNLDTYENARQSVAIIACENVEILYIKTTLFHELLNQHAFCKRLFHNLTVVHIDFLKGRFLPPKETKKLHKWSYTRKNSVLYTFRKIWKYFHIIFVCYFGVIFNLYCSSIVTVETAELYVLFTTDILHFFNFLIMLIANKNKLGYNVIWKIDWRNKYLFILDILTVIPFDAIPLAVPVSVSIRYRWLSVLRIIKGFRILHVWFYFNNCKYKTMNSLHRTLFLYSTAWFLFVIHLLASICILTQIATGGTYENMKFNVVNLEENTYEQKVKFYLNNICYVTAMITKKVQNFFYPDTTLLIGLSIPILFLMSILQTEFIAEVCVAAQRSFSLFTSHYSVTEKMLTLCDGENISQGLRNRLLRYMQLLWRKQKGLKMNAVLIEISPYYRELVMNAAYGHHIFQHYIFRQCHIDFNRQLVPYFVSIFYYPGDYIVFKGTYNECMYFIHAGEVEVLADDGTHDSEVIEILRKGQSFGVYQGLTIAPYFYSYRSKSITSCLILCKKHWNHLLEFFPASKTTIYKRLIEFHE